MPFGYMSPSELRSVIKESPEDIDSMYNIIGSSMIPHILESGIRSGQTLNENPLALLGPIIQALGGKAAIAKTIGLGALGAAGGKAATAALGGDEREVVAIDPTTGQPVDPAQAANIAQQMQDKADDQITSMITQRAQDLYDAMKGLGTDNRKINNIFKDISMNKEEVKKLYTEYVAVLYKEDDLEDGDLVEWLRDDGRDDYANVVAAAVPEAERVLKSPVEKDDSGSWWNPFD